MNHLSEITSVGMVSQQGVIKSALSSQLEQFDDNRVNSQFVSEPVNNNATIDKIRPDDRWFFQAVALMIADECWHDLECFMKAPLNHSSSLGTLCSRVNINHLEIVHFACKHNAPLKVVKRLVLMYPMGVMLPDKMGRLPLHYSAQRGSSGRLMHYFVQNDVLAACTKDKLGKTPLHLICENFNAHSHPTDALGLSCDDYMMWVVKLLLDASPISINIEDDEGMLPLEYAIKSGSPYSVIRFLQAASEKDWKQRNTTWPEDSHANIVRKRNHDQQLKQREHERNREKNMLNLMSSSERDSQTMIKQESSKLMFANPA